MFTKHILKFYILLKCCFTNSSYVIVVYKIFLFISVGSKIFPLPANCLTRKDETHINILQHATQLIKVAYSQCYKRNKVDA